MVSVMTIPLSLAGVLNVITPMEISLHEGKANYNETMISPRLARFFMTARSELSFFGCVQRA